MVGVCETDLCVLLFEMLLAYGGRALIGWMSGGLLYILSLDQIKVIITLLAIIVIFIRRRRRITTSLRLPWPDPRSPPSPPPRPHSPRPQAPRSPSGILRLGQAEVDDVRVGELCPVETQPDLAGLEGGVKQRLGRLLRVDGMKRMRMGLLLLR